MTMTAVISVIIIIGSGAYINKENTTAEGRTAAFGLISLIVGWYAPSPVSAAMRRMNLVIDKKEENS
jgi:hypothetical protein